MYRKVIEHPDYLPQEVRKHTDFEAGKDLGRIWRVTRKTSGGQIAKFDGNLSTEALITKLASANGWERQTAFRLLTERKSAVANEDLAKAFQSATHPAQAAVLLALQSQIKPLDEATATAALSHSSAGIRELAVRLSPTHGKVAERAGDEDPRVRFQTALALGQAGGENRARALAEIVRRDAGDRWARAAVLSGAGGIEEAVLQNLLQGGVAPDLTIINDLAQTLGRRVPVDRRVATLDQVLASAGSASKEVAIALTAGFANATGSLPKTSAVQRLEAVVNESIKLATGSGTSQAKLFAIDLLGFTSFEAAGPALIDALNSSEMQAQTAAVRSLARFQDPQSAQVLLDSKRWNQLPPAIREAVLNATFSRPWLIQALLDSLEKQSLATSAIDSLRRRQLLKHSNKEIRERAEKLFTQPASGDRQRAFEEAKAALALTAHPANGREVFRKLCASCHRIEREGVAVGPDLLDIRNQPKESILLHIVVPEHEIAPGFSAYMVEMKDGRTLAGVVSSETPESITIRQPGGQEETLSRSAVATLSASPFSLMPSGLEKAVTSQEMADLIAYLRGEQ